MNLAVRVPNWLGDAVMALPALEALRQSLPEARLVVVARAGVADLFRLSGLCDDVALLPSPKGPGGWNDTARAAWRLRERRFDAGLLLPNSFESAVAFRLAGVRDCWGYSLDGRGLLLRRAVAPPAKGEIPRHEVFHYLELLRRLGLIEKLPAEASPRLRLSEETRARGHELLFKQGLDGRVVAIAPGAANSRAKQWPPERFVAAARLTAQAMDASVAVFGTPQEQELAESIATSLSAEGVEAKSLAGKTSLGDFLSAIAVCRALITNDSGGMHVAYAAGVPTVAIFGPTIPEETGPLGAHTRIVREPVECSPCMLKDCPIDHRCMTRVSPESVAKVAAELVKLP
ncbi:MAG: lipopolysaccharide heptosyltransferase II [Bryobacterales bacterium]|nr:lipopolysaccharide heptosyltransferase II [Bryobacterales bacterium]